MPELLKLSLRELLVDPYAHSARRAPVDEDYLARLTEALDDGADLPPLKVARVANPADSDWHGGYAPHDARGASERAKRMSRDGWINLLACPDWVLLDGHAVYVALKLRDRLDWPCLVAAEPVQSPDEVLALSLRANLTNGRELADAVVADSLALLWLGHEPRAGETFTPERGAMSSEAICRLLGKKESWLSEQKRYLMVRCCLGLDLGRRRSAVFGRLPAQSWHSAVWLDATHDAPLLHPLRDSKGRVVSTEPKPVAEMTLGELTNWVNWVLSREELPQIVPAPSNEVTREVEQPTRTYQATLPDVEWGRFLEVANDTRRLAAMVKDLPDVDLVKVYDEHLVTYAPLKELHDLAEAELRRRHIDPVAFAAAA